MGKVYPKKNLSKIFDPFVTTKPKGHHGLGLAICYSIISNHNGYINVESKVKMGTTFYVYLPASKKKIRIEDEESDKISKGKGKILIMDDEEDILLVITQILKYLGYEVEVAKDGVETIERYKKAKESNSPFDVVILDLIVPGGMGGKETIKKLISIEPEVKAIVTSGYSNDPIMAKFKQYGFRGVMPKPFDVKKLSQTLHELIKGGE